MPARQALHVKSELPRACGSACGPDRAGGRPGDTATGQFAFYPSSRSMQERPCEVGECRGMMPRRYGGGGRPAGRRGRGAFAQRLAATFPLPPTSAEELGAEHLLQQGLGEHRRNDRVLGAVPRQRAELAVQVAGDVHRADPRRHGGGGRLGRAAGAGAASGVWPDRRAGKTRQVRLSRATTCAVPWPATRPSSPRSHPPASAAHGLPGHRDAPAGHRRCR